MKKTKQISLDQAKTGAAASRSGLWFLESFERNKRRGMRIGVEKVIFSSRSDFQKIEVFETTSFGRMLTLDGVIQITESDNANYHEMISHVPLVVHPRPEKVLVIGGGDGGVVKEILKHPSIKKIHLCELDPAVVSVSRQYFPAVAAGLKSSKVEIFYQDGAKFVQKKRGYYDLIIVDSTDPIGPGKVLFQRPFYLGMKQALRPDGICVTQSESMFYHYQVIKELAAMERRIFPIVKYYYTMVPTYPSGVIGFSFCSKKYDPLADYLARRAKKLKGLKYYTPEIHQAAFCLPAFAAKIFPENI